MLPWFLLTTSEGTGPINRSAYQLPEAPPPPKLPPPPLKLDPLDELHPLDPLEVLILHPPTFLPVINPKMERKNPLITVVKTPTKNVAKAANITATIQ
jgi:hypothetical protein